MQEVGATSSTKLRLRAASESERSEPARLPLAPPCSINLYQSTSPKQSPVLDSLTFTYWIKRYQPVVILAGIISVIVLFYGATCSLQHDSVGQFHRYCTPWHRVASTINHPLPAISGVSSISCEASLCFDEDIGARIVSNEITHLINILNLVDGCGRPFTKIFDPDFE